MSAVVLFASFIAFSIWLFRKSMVAARPDRPPKKRRRDDVRLAFGVVMIVAMAWATSSMVTDADILWPEAVAIDAFAISWLVKGEAYQPVLTFVRWLSAGALAKQVFCGQPLLGPQLVCPYPTRDCSAVRSSPHRRGGAGRTPHLSSVRGERKAPTVTWRDSGLPARAHFGLAVWSPVGYSS